jgi:hypothetical protein
MSEMSTIEGEIIPPAEVTAPKQRKVIGRPFVAGQSGNPAGRPKGARGRFSESFIADLHRVWEERGIAALEKCAVEEPGTFIRTCASLMPKDISLTVGIDAGRVCEPFPHGSSDARQ